MAYILIVDDDVDFTSAVQSALESHGYETAVETVSERSCRASASVAPTPLFSTSCFRRTTRPVLRWLVPFVEIAASCPFCC